MQRGFTMHELLLVMIIVGVIAAMAVPRMSRMQESARYTTTWSQYGRFEAALNLYLSVWKGYPPDVNRATAPPDMNTFIRSQSWVQSPPIGGRWDWNNRTNTSGANVANWITLGPNMSIARIAPDTTIYTRFSLLDSMVDDANQSTGKLRRWNTQWFSLPMPD
jgi:prepilin-type N-terminal cleavage/methylation domain-containing protein